MKGKRRDSRGKTDAGHRGQDKPVPGRGSLVIAVGESPAALPSPPGGTHGSAQQAAQLKPVLPARLPAPLLPPEPGPIAKALTCGSAGPPQCGQRTSLRRSQATSSVKTWPHSWQRKS